MTDAEKKILKDVKNLYRNFDNKDISEAATDFAVNVSNVADPPYILKKLHNAFEAGRRHERYLVEHEQFENDRSS